MKTKLFSFFVFVLSVYLYNGCNKDKETVNDLTLPTITTEPIGIITAESAKCKGIVTDDGGYMVKARGICWSENANPTIEYNVLYSGTGKGEFECLLTKLKAGRTYYVRAFATNILGTQYGEQIDFTTLGGNVILTTNSITSITATSAVGGGYIISDDGDPITEQGVVFGVSTGPSVDNNTGKIIRNSGISGFVVDLTGLTPNTTYYVRAYAVNSTGTHYGNQVIFTTLNKSTGYTLDDYLGEYSIHCKVGIDTDFSTFSPVSINTYISEDGNTWVYIEGLREGNKYSVSYGIWNESEKCILLQGGWYNKNQIFYFTNEPDVFYYSVFFPIYNDENTNTFYYLYGGDDKSGEAKLVMNSDGTISFQGTAPDKNNRTANGFVYCYYLESTGEYKGYFSPYTHITLVPSSAKVKSNKKIEQRYSIRNRNITTSPIPTNGTIKRTVTVVR